MSIKNTIRESVVLKIVAIGFLALILLIPTGMIHELIRERAARQQEAAIDINDKWGESQNLTGPVLTVPYTTNKQVAVRKDGRDIIETVSDKKNVHFLPEKLSINGDVSTDILKRGIYEITVYNSKLNISGEFNFPDFSDISLEKNSVINWDEAYVSISLSDLKALQSSSAFSWNGKEYALKPGFKDAGLGKILAGSGLNVAVPVKADENGKSYKFSLDLDLNGSESINFTPLGKETDVKLDSTWPAPSFTGAFLPDNREVRADGFSANWKVLELNRAYPQIWEGSPNTLIQDSAFGVKLLVPVDEYQKNTRSIKYAVMFIALTFLVFFFVEVLNRIRIHPIQYVLVGLSLVLFFSLLISITEHLNFNLAYLISATATVIMVTLYAKTVFKNMRLTLVLGGILLVVYIFIYSIIQMEDYALLMGSLGLFFVLAVVMFISRKIDWYSAGAKKLD